MLLLSKNYTNVCLWYSFLVFIENMVMKDSRSQNNNQNKQGQSQKPRPEIRDNLDSRSNEEQETKGDDTTTNKKETKTDKLKKKE